MRNHIASLALAFAGLFSNTAMANTNYFFEGIYSGGRGDITADENEVSFDQATVELTVNFGSVNTYNIPHSEAAFLNRSSFISFSQTSLENDEIEEQTSNQASARIVLGSGLFFSAIADIDTEDDDNNIYEARIGKFTSEYTSIFAGYVIDDNDGADIYTAGVHVAAPSGSGSTWMAYDFGGRYFTEGEDSEYAVNLGLTYYPGLRSSLGVLYEYADGRLTDSHETNVFGEYYLSKYISTRIDATVLRLADIEERSAALSFKLRF